AAALDVSLRTVYREVAAGRLGCTRVGSALRFTEQDILDYLADQREPACRRTKTSPDASETTGSARTATASGAARGTTRPRVRHDALRLAHEILMRRSSPSPSGSS